MRSHRSYYFWILSLTVVLMLLILAAQVLTMRNINGLKKGNQEAAVTFTINNRLQEIVNTSAVLQTRLVKENTGTQNTKAIYDSLAVMGYNASVLENLNVDTATQNKFAKLNAFISRQITLSFKILEQTRPADQNLKKIFIDSLNAQNLGDSIYQTAINIEKVLEITLKNTFEQNTLASQKISTLNKIFALIAITAILILGTIIFNRHAKQVSLIQALEKANDEVKKSAAVKEQFLANMSHEIRTPLNAIKGFSRLIQQTPLNEEQQKFSGIIENASNNLLNIVNDILDISKIEAGKMDVEQREFDLKRMLQTLESMFMALAREKKLDYTWSIDKTVPNFLLGDPDRIYQILVNLVGNAFKFTNRGFVAVNISKHAETEKDISLLFSVQDTGIGIAPEKQALIFERFQQITGAKESIQKGTGLGLAIVKNLAVLLGGVVSVNSKEGEGSVFKLVLPFPKSYAETSTGTLTNAANHTQEKFSSAKVLVAEDNQVNQLLITQLLKPYGIQPIIKENGMQVLEALKAQNFDLLLLDIQMPVMDGYKTCEAIRESGHQLPVVAMTAYVMDAEKAKCTAAGMNDYLAKPLDETALNGVLVKYLSAFLSKQQTGPVQDFLLQLAGGDEQMAVVILNQVIEEIPVEIEKLNMAVAQKNIASLPPICHHLVSSISPLGSNSPAMKKISVLQKVIADDKSEAEIITGTTSLAQELEKMYQSLISIKKG